MSNTGVVINGVGEGTNGVRLNDNKGKMAKNKFLDTKFKLLCPFLHHMSDYYAS